MKMGVTAIKKWGEYISASFKKVSGIPIRTVPGH